VVFAELGYGVLDSAVVEIGPSLGEGSRSGSMRTVFLMVGCCRRYL
jgi:hypothetical protein